MKWIVYLLILINLGFALWHYRGQSSSNATKGDEDDALRLVLLKEYLSQQEPAGSSAEQTGTLAKVSCYTLGPFKSRHEATQARERITAAGIKAVRRLDKDNKRKGFWVLIPPEKTRKEANEHIRALKAKGVKDYFLVVTGEYINGVSLGVFAVSESAQRRYNQMKELGFDAKLEQVDLPLREYWLDWPQTQQLSPEILASLRKEYDGIGQAERNCTIQ